MNNQIAKLIADTLAAIAIEATIEATIARAEICELVSECLSEIGEISEVSFDSERLYNGPMLKAA